MLGDRYGTAKVDLDEIGNGMTVGDPAGWQTASSGNPATPLAGQDPIVFESAELPRAWWNGSATTNVQTFVRFPQTSISADGVVSNASQRRHLQRRLDLGVGGRVEPRICVLLASPAKAASR